MPHKAKVRLPTPRADTFLETIQACVTNGERLLHETYDLEFRTPPSSQFFLAMIAQEEFAKAFMLYLVKEGIVPFTPSVLRATNDHACKQLVGMIMDYMIMHWDDIDDLDAAISRDGELGDKMPEDVGSAMELLRYEKIGRWAAQHCMSWNRDSTYDRTARQIAEGKKDRRKQDALYIRIDSDGQVCSTPQTISEGETRTELGPVDKPVLAPARPGRLGRRDSLVATGVTTCSADPTGKQRIKGCRGGFQKES